MKTLHSATYTLCLLTAFVWFPSNTHGLTQEELDAQIQQNLNTPIACGCSVQDYDDLDNRIKIVQIIRSEFASAKTKYAGSKQTMTQAIQDSVQNPIRDRINNERNKKATAAGARTYDFGCFTIISSKATKCLRVALDDHESVHRAACDAHTSSDWRHSQTVEDWLQEEIDSYDKEEQRLREEKSKQLPFCKLDPSVKRRLEQIAEDKEREKEAKEIADWFLGLFN